MSDLNYFLKSEIPVKSTTYPSGNKIIHIFVNNLTTL